MLHIENKKVRDLLLTGNFGLEKENMRVDAQGHLSKTMHPFAGQAHIVRDFSEAQLEVNTGVQPSPAAVVAELEGYNAQIQRTLYNMDKNREYIWPSSNPPQLRGTDDIPIAQFTGDLAQKTEYREHLERVYGKYLMTFSGIHFNYSFSDELLRASYEAAHEVAVKSNEDADKKSRASYEAARETNSQSKNVFETFDEYKEKIYLQVAEYAHAYGFVLTTLTAASPVMDASYLEGNAKVAKDVNFADDQVRQGETKHKNAAHKLPTCENEAKPRPTTPRNLPSPRDLFLGYSSVRCSEAGYWNSFDPVFDYSSVENYARSIQKYVDSGQLAQSSELYFPVRLKPPAQNTTENLIEHGVSHIELRMFDLNPLCRAGIDERDVMFAQLLLTWFACAPSTLNMSDEDQIQATHNFKAAAKYDIDAEIISVPDALFIESDRNAQGAKKMSAKSACLKVIDAMKDFYLNGPLSTDRDDVRRCLNFQREKLTDDSKRYSCILKSLSTSENPYAIYMLNLAKAQQQEYL